MSVMFSQITRLEFGIVVAVLLVLFLCRQPPKSGNADVRRDVGPMQQTPVPSVDDGGQNIQSTDARNPQSAIMSSPVLTGGRNHVTPGLDQGPQLVIPPSSTPTAPMASAASDNSKLESPIPPPPQMKPLGLVDARKCPGLNYDDILCGEVTVRWVWDGAGFVAHKVVVVREKSGVISTWSFDDRDDIVTTEIPQPAR